METKESKIAYFYLDDNFVFKVTEKHNTLFLHCMVSKIDHKVLRQMYVVFRDFKDKAQASGIKEFYSVTPNPKFAMLFGGSNIGIQTHNGKEYEVIKWELK